MSLTLHQGTAEQTSSSLAVSAAPVREESPLCRSMLRGFSHRCRNSLSGIKFGLYLLKKQTPESLAASLIEIEENCLAVEKYFDQLQMAYQPVTLTVVRAAVGPWLCNREPDWVARLERSGKSLVLDPPPNEIIGEIDPHHLGHALDAIVAWRAKRSASGSKARLTWGLVADEVVLEWREDGCTDWRSEQRDQDALSATDFAHECTSLAVMFLQKVLVAHGGSLRCTWNPDFVLSLRWPTRQPVSQSSE